MGKSRDTLCGPTETPQCCWVFVEDDQSGRFFRQPERENGTDGKKCRFGCFLSCGSFLWCYLPAVARQGGPTEMPPGLLGFPRGMIGRAASFFAATADLGV